MFQLPLTIEKVSTLKDKGLKITLETAELSAQEKAEVFNLMDKAIWGAFAETEIRAEDLNIPDFVPTEKKDKTPSARLRAVLFRYWEQHPQTDYFDTFYKKQIERIIDNIKSKLN
jgi:hypothetical protein